MLDQRKQLLQDKEKAYLDLEAEFRLALRIEASRYNELQASHQVEYPRPLWYIAQNFFTSDVGNFRGVQFSLIL
jgi:hypothetical protein